MANNKNEIVVLGRKIPVTIEDREISELFFWAENPRVNSAIKRKYGDRNIADDEVEAVLSDQEHVRELYQEIKSHGGLIDPILVRGNIVLEGNSRLCAYRMLHNKAKEVKNEEEMVIWSYIKCQVIPDDTDEEAIFAILGTWHIKGKEAWDTFEKVAYLKRMKESHGYTSERVAEIIHESKAFVENHIEAHDLMVENEVYELSKFSYFIEIVKNRAIKEAEEKEGNVKGKLIKAVKNGQFERAMEIREVPKVLKDKVAKRTLLEDGESFSLALEIAKERNPEFDDNLYKQLKMATTRLRSLNDKKTKTIKEDILNDTNKKDIVRRFSKQVKIFCKKVGLNGE